ncbi:MAG: hypothetical protein IT379_37400, partial [Deltaproteobacteria bacterium]|nr:hypothetical protein [Deltaproteobacteria bacterium]
LPEGLDAVLVRAMSREPEARFPSAAAFAAALLPFADATTRAQWAASLDVSAALLDVPEPVTEVHAQQSSSPLTPALSPGGRGSLGPSSPIDARPLSPRRGERQGEGAAVTPVAWSASRFGTAPPTDRLGRGLAIGGVVGGLVGALAGAIAMALVASGGARHGEPLRAVAPEPVETRGPANVGARIAEPEPPAPSAVEGLARPAPPAARAEPAPPPLVEPLATPALGLDAGHASTAADAGVTPRAALVAERRVRAARTSAPPPARPSGGPPIGSNRAPILR